MNTVTHIGGNLSRIKVQNQSVIKRMIYFQGPIQRPAIAKALGLTLPTIAANVNLLVEKGIVEEDKSLISPSFPGRPAAPVKIIPNSRYFIGLAIRRTKRHLCIVDYFGKPVFTAKDNTLLPDYDENIRASSEMLKQAVNNSPIPVDKIAGVGVSVPGIVDSSTGRLLTHRQYYWADKDVCGDLLHFSSCPYPLYINNDACARIYGQEVFYHEGLRGISSCAYLYISTGIACPLVIRDPQRMTIISVGPGELGYMVLEPSLDADQHGVSNGTLSSLAGERALRQQANDLVHSGQAPLLAKICGGREPTIPQILEAQQAGEQSADQLIKRAVFYLGVAVANVDNFVRPEKIFVDTNLISGDEQNQEVFFQTVQKHLFSASGAKPNIVFVESDEFTGAKCAAAVAILNDFDTYVG